MPQRICDTPDCGKPHRARGLCSAHWKRKYAPLRTYDRVPCSVCGEPALKTSGRYRIVCSLACRWFLQNERHSTSVRFPSCEWCRAVFASRTGVDRWCSGACEATATRERWPASRVFFPTCTICSARFASRLLAVTCSAACGAAKLRDDRRAAKHRRRARKRNAYVADVRRRDIYERDQWTCRLCLRPLKREAEVPHPLAPTIDHVIPLADGGTHEPANVQAAHFQCNVTKGAGYVKGGEQLMLIG